MQRINLNPHRILGLTCADDVHRAAQRGGQIQAVSARHTNQHPDGIGVCRQSRRPTHTGRQINRSYEFDMSTVQAVELGLFHQRRDRGRRPVQRSQMGARRQSNLGSAG